MTRLDLTGLRGRYTAERLDLMPDQLALDLSALMEYAEKARGLARQFEHLHEGRDGQFYCPDCARRWDAPHCSDCDLAALL